MGSGIHKKTVKNIAKILDLLRERGPMHIRGIAKALELNPFTVSNIIDHYLDFFIEVRSIDQFGFRVKLINLKPGKEETTLEDVLKYVKVKRKIKGS
jgi:hypothetical protein